MKKISYSFTCPACKCEKVVEIPVSNNDALRVELGLKSIKECTTPGTFYRELFISGLCFQCQEEVFHRPAPGHEEEWGECVSECPICGTPLYQMDIDKDKCPSCNHVISEAMQDECEEEY